MICGWRFRSSSNKPNCQYLYLNCSEDKKSEFHMIKLKNVMELKMLEVEKWNTSQYTTRVSSFVHITERHGVVLLSPGEMPKKNKK